MDDSYPRSADAATARLYDAASDYELPVLDELLRRADLRWDHIGCWTNSTRRRTCEGCGQRRTTLAARDEVLPSA